MCSDLHGSQYSWLGSIVYVAQLIWQPVSSYLILKMPVAKYCEFSNISYHSHHPDVIVCSIRKCIPMGRCSCLF